MMYILTVLTVFGLWVLATLFTLVVSKRHGQAVLIILLQSALVIIVLVHLHYNLPR